MESKNILTLTPLGDYEAPKLPTYSDAKLNLEKKIPHRWKNRALIAMTAGLLGTTALTGCSVSQNVEPAPTIYCPDLHYGGAGGGPLYVVHLTEQEALEMIRNQLEEVGLNLNEVLSPYNVIVEGIYEEGFDGGEPHRLFQNGIEMHLLDEENEIGIVTHRWGWALDGTCTIETNERIVQRFLDEHDILVGVFFRGRIHIGWDDNGRDLEEYEDEIAQAMISLENELTDQIQDFIAQLREEDIID